MKTFSLPQNDKSADRTNEMVAAKNDNTLGLVQGIPLGSTPPAIDSPEQEYLEVLYKALFKRHANIRAVAEESGFKFSKDLPKMDTVELLKMLLTGETTKAVPFYSPDLGQVVSGGRAKSLADFDRLYQRDAIPEISKTALEDSALANVFLGGSEPDVLKRMNKIPDNFPITDAHLRSAKGFANDSLSQAISSGRVYFIDYKILSKIKDGVHPQQPKYLYAPLCAFAVPAHGGPMMPFAIKLNQSASASEIYTPSDNWSWKIASTMVRAAANAHSATISHLTQTHLTLEPIAVCTARHLSQKHPLFALIHPHIINTRSINRAAFQVLVLKDQFVDRMTGGDIDSTLAMVSEHRFKYDFSGDYVSKRFVRNQTDDARILKNYQFRDDSMIVWNAIHSWVADYLTFYYKNDAQVRADFEVQAWAKDIGSPDYGKVYNFTPSGGMESLAELIDTVTMIIFTAGPQHAAVNFAQRTDLSYAPAAPMAGYTPIITGKGHTEQDWLNVLPPLDVGLVQLQLTLILGDIYYTNLGGYRAGIFEAPIAPMLSKYQAELAKIEDTINARNKSGRIPYVHLLPSKIPQSTNI